MNMESPSNSEAQNRVRLLSALVLVLSGYGIVLNTDTDSAPSGNTTSNSSGMPAVSFDGEEFMRAHQIVPEPVDDGSHDYMHPDSLHPDIRDQFAHESFKALVEAQRDWTLKYIQSPMYHKILIGQIRTQYNLSTVPPSEQYIQGLADQLISERSSRVARVPVNFKDHIFSEDGTDIYGHAWPNLVEMSKSLLGKDPSGIVHELAHVGQGGTEIDGSWFALYPQVSMYISGLAMGQSPEELQDYIVDRRAFLVGAEQYQYRAWEVMSFVTQLKFYADIMGVMDPLHDEFTREHYIQLKRRMMKILPDNSWLRVYFNNLPAENVIELINSVAEGSVRDDDVVMPGPTEVPVSKMS